MDIKSILRRHGYSIADAALRMDISAGSLSATIRRGTPTPKTLHRIADAIGADYEEFFADTTEFGTDAAGQAVCKDIKMVLQKHGYTVTQAAKAMGVMRSTLSSNINAKTPSVKFLRRLAEAIGADYDEFFRENQWNDNDDPKGQKTPKVSTNIRRVVKEHKLTIKEVAKRMGMPRAALSKIISGGRPQTKTLHRIADAIGCQYEDFFDFKPCEERAGGMDVLSVIRDQGYTMAQVASMMTTRSGKPVSPTYLSKMLNHGNPTVNTLQQIATIIGVEVGAFFKSK